MDICVGDKVKLIDHKGINGYLRRGDTGKIVGFYNDEVAQVRWDRVLRNGHDCQGNCEYGYGWNVKLDRLEPITENVAIDVSEYL